MNTEHDLERFVAAQEPVYDQVLAELRGGRKRSHWIWFIFPQLEGLGYSPTARLFAIKSRDEARGYLAHPLLGARLRECTEVLVALPAPSISDILGFPDDLKFRSSMTLFNELSGPGSVFAIALDRFFGGKPDDQTLQLLERL